MRTTTSIQFYCRPSKCRKNNEAPIEVSLTLNGTRKMFQTSLKCEPKIFGTKKQPKNITQYLDSLRVNLVTTISEMVSQGIPLTTANLKRLIQQGGVKSYTLNDLFKEYNQILENRVKSKEITKIVAKRYYFIEDLLKKEIGGDTELDCITPGMMQGLYAKWQTKYEDSSLAGMMTKLKTVFRYAKDNNQLKSAWPFQNLKIKKGVKPITYLTDAEIDRLTNTPLDNECLEKVRDCAVFQLGSGIAYGDCLDLKKEDLCEKEGQFYISKARHKTSVPYFAVLSPDAVRVFKKYDGKLPFISNQKYNQFLKVLALRCNINKRLHSHLFRHSYCTTLLSRGIALKTISRCVGHSSSRTTEQFYAFLKEDAILNEVGKVL